MHYLSKTQYFGCPLPTDGGELEHLADRLGVSTFGIAVTAAGRTAPDTALLQQRIRDSIRHQRDSWLWIVALISTLASLASALAAWTAVLHR